MRFDGSRAHLEVLRHLFVAHPFAYHKRHFPLSEGQTCEFFRLYVLRLARQFEDEFRKQVGVEPKHPLLYHVQRTAKKIFVHQSVAVPFDKKRKVVFGFVQRRRSIKQKNMVAVCDKTREYVVASVATCQDVEHDAARLERQNIFQRLQNYASLSEGTFPMAEKIDIFAV